MDYIKIAEIANKCEVISKQITEYYRLIGSGKLTEGNNAVIYNTINNLNNELDVLKSKLKKLVA